MAWFQWISHRPLPVCWDLRRNGWQLATGEQFGGEGEAAGPVVRLIDGAAADAAPERLPPALRPRALALGIDDSAARVRWLAMGYADALPGDLGSAELAVRATRAVAPLPGPARRRLGRMSLDLLTRDARIDDRRLRLHPREFALLWRLAELPGALVTRAALLRDVFDLNFDPGTNRLAVHVCRLRKKLAAVGFAELLTTAPGESGYRLTIHSAGSGQWDERGDPPQRIPLDAQFSLDPLPRLGEHARSFEELAQ